VRWRGRWSAVLVLVSCTSGRLCTGQGDQLAPGTDRGSLVVLWELVTLTLWRNPCQWCRAGARVGVWELLDCSGVFPYYPIRRPIRGAGV
jgi:hypothetical protein